MFFYVAFSVLVPIGADPLYIKYMLEKHRFRLVSFVKTKNSCIFSLKKAKRIEGPILKKFSAARAIGKENKDEQWKTMENKVKKRISENIYENEEGKK